jgi:hypothetical protein
MNLLNSSEELVLHSGFNTNVDFCVWVLEQDGLKVDPFVHHVGGNRALRKQGITETGWLEWFGRVLKTQDQRLNWHVENIPDFRRQQQGSFDRMRDDFNRANPQSQIVSSVDGLDIESKLAWQEQQYQKAITLVGNIPISYENPSILWNGSKSIQETLVGMWDLYKEQKDDRTRKFEEHMMENFGVRSESNLYSELYDRIKKSNPRPDALEIYQVIYPQKIEFILSPSYAVMSLENGFPGSPDFCQSIEVISRRLIASLG